MGRWYIVSVVGLLAAVAARGGAAFHGEMILADDSNAGRPVGASPEAAIPGGHTLRIEIRDGRFGGRPAAGATVAVVITKGGERVYGAACTLDEAGCGAVTVLVPVEWNGQYHVDADVVEAGTPQPGTGRLEGEFRVIESEPAPEVPYALPAALLGLAAVTLVIWWTRRAPRTA